MEVAAELAALDPRPRIAVYTGYGRPDGVVDRVLYKPDPPHVVIDWVRSLAIGRPAPDV